MRGLLVLLVIVMVGCGTAGDDELPPLGKPLNQVEKEELIGELRVLREGGVAESVVVEWVKRLRRPVPLEVEDIVKLKEMGLGERVIRLMIRGAPPEIPVK